MCVPSLVNDDWLFRLRSQPRNVSYSSNAVALHLILSFLFPMIPLFCVISMAIVYNTNGAGTRLHGKELNKRPIAALDCLPRRPKFSSSFPMYNIWAGSARFVSPTGMLFEMFDIFSRMLHWLFDRAHLSLSFVYVSLLSTLSSSHYPYWY